MKRKIAIIGATEFQNPLILKAKELGFETFVYAWKCGTIGETTADHFIPINVREMDKVYEDCVKQGVEAAVTIASDLTTLTANYVQRKLGKPCNPEITDLIATNKYEMRKAFMSNGIDCPKFIRVNSIPKEENLKDFRYPLIVKPTDRSGSRGIHKVNSYEELKEAAINSCEASFEKQAIIEEFFEGNEYSLEGISFNGEHHFLAFTKKHTTGAPHFIETGHDEPSDLSIEIQNKVKDIVSKALDALHIEVGASHSEFIVDKDNNIHIVEIGPRMGGDCIGSHLVNLSTGYDFMRMVIDCALGNETELEQSSKHKKASIRFIFTSKDLDKYIELSNNKEVEIVEDKINIEDITNTVTNSTDRHGYYIYTIK